MVLLRPTNLYRAYGGCKGPISRTKKNDTSILSPRAVLLNLCKACQIETMATIPPSAFSAARIRETQRDRDMKLAKKIPKPNEYSKFFETSFADLSPLKYNSKMMNSIWGRYNWYSPHNVKKINEALSFNRDLQPSTANSVNKPEPVITLSPGSLDNVWPTIFFRWRWN